MRAIIREYQRSLPYAILFVIVLTAFLTMINASMWQIFGTDFKAIVLVSGFLTVNSFLKRDSVLHRVLWNLIFILPAAIFLFIIDLSLPGIAIKIISRVPFIGTLSEKTGILLKIPEAIIWSGISCAWGWVAGKIQFEELTAFQRKVIDIMDDIKYR